MSKDDDGRKTFTDALRRILRVSRQELETEEQKHRDEQGKPQSGRRTA